MHIRLGGLCLMLQLSLVACSSDDVVNAGAAGNSSAGNSSAGNSSAGNSSAGNSSMSSSGGGNAVGGNVGSGNGGQTSTAAAGAVSWAGNGNVDCPTWPRSKVFPTVGPFFYGPNPGPCTMTVAGLTHEFNYDATGQLTQQAAADGSEVVTYQYDQGLLARETSTRTSGATVTNYQYVANTVSYVSTSPSGARTDITYTVDSMGYPLTTLVLGSPSPSTPHHFVYVYENCRLTQRVAYNVTNVEIADQTARYTYDSLGRVSHRTTATRDEVYDYSCW